jgi:hypothetical protein
VNKRCVSGTRPLNYDGVYLLQQKLVTFLFLLTQSMRAGKFAQLDRDAILYVDIWALAMASL